MDASELILNLVQKAAIKTEAKKKDLCDREHFSKRENSPSPDRHAVVKNSFSRGVPEKSCDDCKKEKAKGEIFKVSLTTDDEGLKNDKENVPRKKIRVEARQICDNREKSNEEKIFVLQKLGRSQIHPDGFPAFLCIDDRIADSNGVKRKIPRPANAFMLFANEWRKKLAAENPRESNKDISIFNNLKMQHSLEEHGERREGKILRPGPGSGCGAQKEISRSMESINSPLVFEARLIRFNVRKRGLISFGK
ncbi:hypothetical protein WN51_00129 [Melipona quadrifasciata]|uniref:HMG box domain-containing protein n=1 Tax=Melipona quadrifasciata TaxID=166423 RepID=A0A0N0U7P3_9HYME|nr:hypothetical protein WN51_00129 [Melipona quadrifasciata]